jgi:hypothetical protein
MPKTEHQLAIEKHASSPKVQRAVAALNAKVAMGSLSASYWVTFLTSVMLPMLPSLLKQAAPKILANTKLLAILRATRDVINGILDE